MKLGILSRGPGLYSTRRLVEAAQQRGHDVRVVDYLRCYMNITSHHPQVLFRGEALDFDAVVPRIASRRTFYGTSVVRQFEMMGVYTANESQAISRSRDKLRSLQILSRTDVQMPHTGFAEETQDIDGVIDAVGGPPLVVKLLQGSQGVGVVLVESKSAARSVIDAFRQVEANILIQEYIKEAKGRDIRCMVVGDRVVAAMERVSDGTEFRANLHQGGSVHEVDLATTEIEYARMATKAHGLESAGVDILRSDRGPLVLEVNSSPGFEGIETATGVDIAGLMVDHIENQLESLNPDGQVSA
ncbi:MAG: 30S ribosomal protein S6--L-glutamate ligase [Dehalococcoidia bacterium]|nr:30S ribosomal protein S6--L-glutamate ligase [Chloroflexota bacterium]MDP6056110.1 30S ribosomal protein S6--L-glutamate ligase [Dehalococcoidia bacterium]MDP7262530.1 30S ribosomal protein S6--L-glutamate ligase [Dehalococcoidia bacterium]MDP7486131.1 30S ribosomal protein S6--L-glutamate ligase [Dehalococcoidia bacterium]